VEELMAERRLPRAVQQPPNVEEIMPSVPRVVLGGRDEAFLNKITKAKDDDERAVILADELWEYRKKTDAVTWQMVDSERNRLNALIEEVLD
jgi:hypothetical protein